MCVYMYKHIGTLYTMRIWHWNHTEKSKLQWKSFSTIITSVQIKEMTRFQFLVVCPGFWLSVLGIYKIYTRMKMSFGYRFMVGRQTTAWVFLVVRSLFWLSWAHGQPKFWMLIITLKFVCYCFSKILKCYSQIQVSYLCMALTVAEGAVRDPGMS